MRCVCAFVAAVIVGAMIGLWVLLISLASGYGLATGRPEVAHGMAQSALRFDGFAILFLALMVFAAIAGFILGPDKTIRAFGIFWGTESPTALELWIGIPLIVLLGFALIAYLIHRVGAF